MQTEINGVPDKYLEIDDYIVYVIPDNFVVAKVTNVKKEDSKNSLITPEMQLKNSRST